MPPFHGDPTANSRHGKASPPPLLTSRRTAKGSPDGTVTSDTSREKSLRARSERSLRSPGRGVQTATHHRGETYRILHRFVPSRHLVAKPPLYRNVLRRPSTILRSERAGRAAGAEASLQTSSA